MNVYNKFNLMEEILLSYFGGYSIIICDVKCTIVVIIYIYIYHSCHISQ